VGDRKYKAFISYSHADEAWGGWLQRSLERFRAPGKLAAALEARGVSARLSPVFRDREDLPVAGSLNAAIQAALADSQFQIVLCSPNSAKSKWVNEEIKLFHKLHGPDRVFALIIDGEPNATLTPGREAEECFPPALRFILDADGNPTDAPGEPLAADARKDGDGKRYALLKVAAGMLGVGLDELVRRDAARRARQAWTVAGASFAGMAATIALSIFAIAKSNEATLMRGKAENLIEFMLTDLNQKLEPVGRLDVLESVVAKVMDYYADQDPKSLNDDALARRAKAMMQLGTIDYRQNKFNDAQKAYESAEAATAELLKRAPNNPDRIFDHAQNVFYVGEAARHRYDAEKNERQFNEYLRLAQRLVKLDGDNPRSQLELAYATSNIGITRFADGLFNEAIPYFEKSIAARADLLAADPKNDGLRRAYAYSISWLAFALLQKGDFLEAISQFRKQLAAYGDLAKLETQDYSALDAVVTAQRRLASAYALKGDIAEALKANAIAETTAKALVERDPRNANWNINASFVMRGKSRYLFFSGDLSGAETAADEAIRVLEPSLTEDAPQLFYFVSGESLSWRLALLGDRAPSPDAERIEQLIAAAIKSDPKENAEFIAEASLTLARSARRRGADDDARAILDRSIAAIRPMTDRIPAMAKIGYAAACMNVGELDRAAPLIAEMEALGVRHPDFLALKSDFQKLAAR